MLLDMATRSLYLGMIGPTYVERSFQNVNGALMSGKPQFDDVAVIAAATDVFWRNGYPASAISDLAAATGLSRSSLYQRFQDKDGLFQEALEAYTQRVLRRMDSAKGATARERLKAVLRAFLPERSRPSGCLIGRSCAGI